MRKKARLCCLLLLAVLLFSGCAPFSLQNINDLLRAPALGQGQGEIQKALKEYLGEEPQYKFPKEGEWRSPLVMADLNGDDTQEAVLLYSLTSNSNTMYIAVLEQVEGNWEVKDIEEGIYPDVASVEVANMFADGSRQLIVGFTTATMAAKTLVLYQYAGAQLLPKTAGNYSNYLLGNLTGTGRMDIAVVSPLEEVGGLTLDFLTGTVTAAGEKDFTKLQKTVELNKNFKTCEGIYPGKNPSGDSVLVIDGKNTADVLISQILHYSSRGEGFYDMGDSAEIAAETARLSSLLRSKDINNDGMVEIPVQAQSTIVPASLQSSLSYVEWINFLGDTPALVQYGVLDSEKSFYIRLPSEWQGYAVVAEGKTTDLWLVKDSRTGEVLLELRHLEAGELPPGESKRVPGSSDLYFFPKSTVSAVEKLQITVTVLE